MEQYLCLFVFFKILSALVIASPELRSKASAFLKIHQTMAPAGAATSTTGRSRFCFLQRTFLTALHTLKLADFSPLGHGFPT